jgi:hypothetical protein
MVEVGDLENELREERIERGRMAKCGADWGEGNGSPSFGLDG